MRSIFKIFGLLLVAAGISTAQEAAAIRVDAAAKIGPYNPIYSYFGYDEPNYTYTANGKKLIGELAGLSRNPVFIRTHFMLATGDGTAGLKWGSTNAYSEDAFGKSVYDWTIADRIFDTYLKAGAKPFAEIGFMPQALSSKPEPYAPTWIPGDANKNYYIGWTYPPNDYKKWGELVYEWVRHCTEKYGEQEVEQWYWEVWNEPDIAYWHGTPEEYDKLYDYAVAGVRRALPHAKVGGPASTSPRGEKAASFLRQFLVHCDQGANEATGGVGAPLDFVTFHAKGSPTVVDGHVRMGMAKEVQDVETGFAILNSFTKFRALPVVLSEADPEGCAACSARVYPQNAYRNGPLYASYTAAMMKRIFELADASKTNIAGMLTWAFEFENQPYFDGFRTLATNGIDKPVLNLFRMAGMMAGDRVQTQGGAAVDALAVGKPGQLSVLVWNYNEDDVPGPTVAVTLQISSLPQKAKRVRLVQYRIDDENSNAWTAWKKMGSPQKPTAAQYAELENAGKLQQLQPPHKLKIKGGRANIDFALPRQAVSLLRLNWTTE